MTLLKLSKSPIILQKRPSNDMNCSSMNQEEPMEDNDVLDGEDLDEFDLYPGIE